MFVARVGRSNVERFRDRKFVMSKQWSGEGVTVAPSENIYSCLQTSFMSKENGYISCTLKIRTEDLTTGNLLSTAEIEPGSNNISHNEKKGTVSL